MRVYKLFIFVVSLDRITIGNFYEAKNLKYLRLQLGVNSITALGTSGLQNLQKSPQLQKFCLRTPFSNFCFFLMNTSVRVFALTFGRTISRMKTRLTSRI